MVRLKEYIITPIIHCQSRQSGSWQMYMYFKRLQYLRHPLKYMLFVLLYLMFPSVILSVQDNMLVILNCVCLSIFWFCKLLETSYHSRALDFDGDSMYYFLLYLCKFAWKSCIFIGMQEGDNLFDWKVGPQSVFVAHF
jgi:hypothetical protein